MAPKRPAAGSDRPDRPRNRRARRERARLIAASAALDRDMPPRFSQDDVAAYLADHPDSTYTEIADGLGASPTNIAAHLKRGRQAGTFRKSTAGA